MDEQEGEKLQWMKATGCDKDPVAGKAKVVGLHQNGHHMLERPGHEFHCSSEIEYYVLAIISSIQHPPLLPHYEQVFDSTMWNTMYSLRLFPPLTFWCNLSLVDGHPASHPTAA